MLSILFTMSVRSFYNCFCIALLLSAFVSGKPHYEHNTSDPDFKLYTKQDWIAQPATDLRPLQKPVEYVIIHHTYIPGACNTTDQCKTAMQSMQRFCVGSDGAAYEGRGWDVVGIHAGMANGVSVGICLIGDWRYETPPPQTLETTKALIKQGVSNGAISPDYKLIGHGQVTATECPGEALLSEISTWEHFHPGPFVRTSS